MIKYPAMGRKEADRRMTRRRFLTAVTPLGWLPAARSGLPIRYWHRSTQISALKDAALVGGFVLLLNREKTPSEKLRERAEAFTWKDAQSPEKLQGFVSELADGYLFLTQTSRVKKDDLIGEGKTNFYHDRASYLKALAEKGYTQGPREWGAASYEGKGVFIDLSTLRSFADRLGQKAGFALLDGLWHEWGHLDVAERTSGRLINNPQYVIKSPTTGIEMPFKKYRGVEVYITEKEGLFHRFEEVLNEAITVRRITEQVGIANSFFQNLYYENGLDFFVEFTKRTGISLKTLYETHATSDFEGLANLVGRNLPGAKTPIDKGLDLFLAVERNNREMLRQTGVFTRL